MPQQKVYAVFGLGKFGSVLCQALSAKGGQVIAADNQEALVSKIKEDVAQALLIDTTDEEALKNAGVAEADVAIVAIGDDIDASILTTAILKNLGVPYIVARAVSDIHAQVLRRIGATEVIIIEEEQGQRLARRLIAPDVMDVIPLSAGQSLAEVRVPKSMVGKSLRELALRQRYGVIAVSLKRNATSLDEVGNPVRQEQVLTPRPEDVFQSDDVLVVVGNAADIEKVKEE